MFCWYKIYLQIYLLIWKILAPVSSAKADTQIQKMQNPEDQKHVDVLAKSWDPQTFSSIPLVPNVPPPPKWLIAQRTASVTVTGEEKIQHENSGNRKCPSHCATALGQKWQEVQEGWKHFIDMLNPSKILNTPNSLTYIHMVLKKRNICLKALLYRPEA